MEIKSFAFQIVWILALISGATMAADPCMLLINFEMQNITAHLFPGA